MSLSCLICNTNQKKEFDLEAGYERNLSLRFKTCCVGLERNWSGNLSPPRYKKIRNDSAIPINKSGSMKGHRRVQSMAVTSYEGACSPRLVRSGGMRRDWSFEDLRKFRNAQLNFRDGGSKNY
ncbi:hypothetical protein AQUCO_02600420v1 [Aquilegia coerulea]|uniref:Uncharacterized protein n=1 Tax=Aquilegia coerulea TaxID=218851 RepID=A0A2G5D9R6_AQUCA|nr:hypothetical protein AQUCO_02600420v1 [Aquilegia coerulea]